LAEFNRYFAFAFELHKKALLAGSRSLVELSLENNHEPLARLGGQISLKIQA